MQAPSTPPTLELPEAQGPAGENSESADSRTILLVDDDPHMLACLRSELERVVDPAAVLVAEGGEEALRTVDVRTVDLLITKLTMPGVDGCTLLRRLRERRFRGRSVVMSGSFTRDLELELRDLGALVCLPQPIDTERLLGLCRRVLNDCDGELHGFSPAGIAQLLEVEGKSCLLRMRRGETIRGDLVFSRGRLVDASTSTATGEAAALTILAWQDADLHVFDLPPSEPASIERPLQELIMEAARLEDENRRDSQAVGWDDADLGSWLEEEGETQVKLPCDDAGLSEFASDELDAAIQALLDLDGARRVALIDVQSGRAIKTAERGSACGTQGAGLVDLQVLAGLSADNVVEDVLTTLRDHYHLMRPLRACRRLLLHLVLERSKSNLALARHSLAEVEARMQAA